MTDFARRHKHGIVLAVINTLLIAVSAALQTDSVYLFAWAILTPFHCWLLIQFEVIFANRTKPPDHLHCIVLYASAFCVQGGYGALVALESGLPVYEVHALSGILSFIGTNITVVIWFTFCIVVWALGQNMASTSDQETE